MLINAKYCIKILKIPNKALQHNTQIHQNIKEMAQWMK